MARLLRTRASPLLAAKVLVVSRLLHQSLAQAAHDVPPFLDVLKTRLAALRRKLLVGIDARFARFARSGAAPDVDVGGLVEALCAFSLATSSRPRDVFRHFLHVRREALVRLLEGREGDGDGDGGVLEPLRVYLRTLQDGQRLFPKRLAEALAKLKAQPLLRDPDVRGLMELNLDLHERWVADEVRTFTPWVRHEDLRKEDAETLLGEWARKAFEAFRAGLRVRLEGIEDLMELVGLRKRLLETWLAPDGPSPGLVTSEVLGGLRSAMNIQLKHVIRRRVELLHLVGSEVQAVIEAWKPGVSDVHLSLWDASMTGMDVSNGAAAFKQAILNRSHGRNDTLFRVLDKWNIWLRSVDEVGTVIESLKRTKWDVDLDADDDDEELELESKERLLNKDDPRELQETFKDTLVTAMSGMESKLHNCAATFSSDHRPQQSLFLLRLLRELRQHLPRHYQNPRFGLSLVPTAHQTLAHSILHAPFLAFERSIRKTSRTRKVATRALWQGTPPLPVQPSVAVFKLLHGVVEAMSEVGSDVWTADATDVLKREMRARLVPLLDGTGDARTETTSTPARERTDRLTDAERQEQESKPESAETVGEGYRHDDFDVQLLFDAIFLRRATALKLAETESGGDDDRTSMLGPLAGKMQSKLADGVGKEGLDAVRRAAEAYWGKVALLFGLLA